MLLLDKISMEKEERELRELLPKSALLHNCLVLHLSEDGVERDFWKFDGLLVCHDKTELNLDKIIVFNNKDKDKLLYFENLPTDADNKNDDLRKGLKSWLQGQNLQQRVLLAAPRFIRDIFQELLFEFGKVVDWEAPCHQYSLSIEDGAPLGYQRDTKCSNAPLGSDKNEQQPEEKDLVVSELGTNQVESVMSSWSFREVAGQEATVRGMLEDMVTQNRLWGIFPSSPSSSPAAWVALYSYGSLGMLHTKEEYRRQGFASELVRTTCKIVRMRWGLTPTVHVEHDNGPSEHFFQQLKFSPQNESVIWTGFK